MNDIQKKLLAIYKIYKSICDKNGLRYYADGGTRLGAIRHKGFIPWDDDIDIAMPLSDYNKFIKIAQNELPDYIELVDGLDQQNVDYSFVRLSDSRTTFIHRQDLPFLNQYKGVCVDIFPYIGTNSADVFSDHNKKLDLMSDELTNKKLYDIGSKSLSALKRERQVLFEEYDIETAKYVRSGSVSMWKYNAIFERKSFLESNVVPFEDTEVPVSVGFDEELTSQYGDYMKYPPKSQQVSHHFGFVDLERPYSVYQQEAEGKFVADTIAYAHSLQKYCYEIERKLIEEQQENAEELKHKEYFIAEAERKYENVKKELDQVRSSRTWKAIRFLRGDRG